MGLGINTEDSHSRDSFDEFMDSLQQPRQVMAPEMDKIEAELDMTPAQDPLDYSDDDTPTDQKKRYNLSMIPAETLVNCVDIAFVQVNSMIAKEKMEGATEEEKDSLIQAAANYLKEKDIDISPSSMLFVMVLVVYAPKVFQAVELRKANEDKQLMQKQIEEQKLKIAMLEKKEDDK